MSLLFRPIRLIEVCGVAFMAGVFFERLNQHTNCEALDGDWTDSNLCTMEAENG